VLAEKYKLTYRSLKIPNKTIIALLQHGAKTLRSRGIFVYMQPDKPTPLIAGKCGRVYEKLRRQADYLSDLSDFIKTHNHELPRNMIAKKKKIDYYKSTTVWSFLCKLEELYRQGDKEALKSLCEEAWKFAEEVDAYLESIIDLRRLHAISLIL
jgi:hypothetical protein